MRPVARIRVHYPTPEVLRIRGNLDWDEALEPVLVEQEGRVQHFEVPLPPDRPFVYYKVVRLREGAMDWSVGANHYARADERDVYPHFDGRPTGRITDRLELGGRTTRVYLPPGYDENTLKRYPVLYVHDGSNVFFPDEAFTGVEWAIDEALDCLDAMNLVDKVIVVALYADPDRREEEYTAPGYHAYGRALVEAVVPAVNAAFRTLTVPSATAVMGSSFGGVVSLHLALAHPEVFGMAACISSTFGRRDDLAERVRLGRPSGVRVYLDSGWPGDNYDETREMRDLLLAHGYRVGCDLMHLAFPGALHHERSWSQRVHLPFQFLFGDAWRPGGPGNPIG